MQQEPGVRVFGGGAAYCTEISPEFVNNNLEIQTCKIITEPYNPKKTPRLTIYTYSHNPPSEPPS